MGMTPEGRVKAKVDKMLKEFEPELWFYAPQSGIYGRSGVPDRVGCYYGQMIGIECKVTGKQPTDLQMACMKAMSRAGARCFVVYDDVSLNVVREYLTAMKTRERLLL